MTDDVRRALAVTAHPDDIDFGAAGTIATMTRDGWEVSYCVVTSGQKGVQDVDADPYEFGLLREAEQVAAAKEVGVTDVTFLGLMDSQVEYGLELQKLIARQFRIKRPHRLFCMDPQPIPTDRFVNHPDHRHVGQATLDVTMTSGTTAAIFPELIRDEGLQPWRQLEEVWVMGPAGGSTVVDVTDTIDLKMAALRAHSSQTSDWDFETFLRNRLAGVGEPHGFAYAESFRAISYRR